MLLTSVVVVCSFFSNGLPFASDFGDIFDTKHFITSLKDELRIIKEVPEKFRARVRKGSVVSLPPVSWSNESYYLNQVCLFFWSGMPENLPHGEVSFCVVSY